MSRHLSSMGKAYEWPMGTSADGTRPVSSRSSRAGRIGESLTLFDTTCDPLPETATAGDTPQQQILPAALRGRYGMYENLNRLSHVCPHMVSGT